MHAELKSEHNALFESFKQCLYNTKKDAVPGSAGLPYMFLFLSGQL